jgi:ATP-dependent helicase/nuclease subunit A
MAWLRAADTEVKRDMEISRDEVRVMTVHGAKGLEASVVFLVDTTSSPADIQRLRLIRLQSGKGREVVVWAGKKADDPKPVAIARQKMLDETENEYRRLLYVAMTRAADRLIVGGCQPGNRNGIRESCWYDLIKKGLSRAGLVEATLDTDDGPVTRFFRPEDVAAASGTAEAPAARAREELPAWLRTPVREQLTAALLRPSGAGAETGRVRSAAPLAERSRALLRGTLVHRLLQSLPDLPPARRRGAANDYLARNASGWSKPDRDALAEKVLSLVDDPRFAPVFADGSRAEVPIVGRLALPGRPAALVSGQIDRLVVTADEVLIVDFKTNHAPPDRMEEAPRAYISQLAFYRAVLSKLYPRRRVRAALLWTESAELMEILAPALDAELSSFTAGRAELDPATPRS